MAQWRGKPWDKRRVEKSCDKTTDGMVKAAVHCMLWGITASDRQG